MCDAKSRFQDASPVRDGTQPHPDPGELIAKKLQSQLEEDLKEGLEPSTCKQYAVFWQSFSKLFRNYSILPAAPLTIFLYLHNLGLKSSTIRSRLSAISERRKPARSG